MSGHVTLLQPDDTEFPDPEQALSDPNGLLAIGGQLTSEWLLRAYHQGIFPWFDRDDSEPLWWTPDPRAVLFPDEFRISRSLAKRLRRKDYRVTLDTQFAAVIDGCAQPRRASPGTWITDQMKHAYIRLHSLGYAHSVEAWQDDLLVGGLYGISLGKMFFGESMFSKLPDASKVAFATLIQQLRTWQFELIDCQILNAHLASLGAREIPRHQFLARLYQNNTLATRVGKWQFESGENT